MAHFLVGADAGVRKSQALTVWGGAAQHGAVLIPNYVVGCSIGDGPFRVYCKLCCVPHGRVIRIEDLLNNANQIAPTIAGQLDRLCEKGFIQPVYDMESAYPVGINIPPIQEVILQLHPETGNRKKVTSNIRKSVDLAKKVTYRDFRPDNVSVEAWDDWLEYRRRRRLTLSDLCLKRQAGLLLGQAENGDECIYQSIRNGWTGLFEFKGKPRVRQEGRILREQNQQLFEDIL